MDKINVKNSQNKESNSDFGIVLLEVELLSLWSNDTRGFLVYLVDIVLESSLSFGGSKIEGEFLSVLDWLELLFAEPHGVSFVHEVSAVGFWSDQTVVHEEFEGSPLGSRSSSGWWGHVRVEVVMGEGPPFSLEFFAVHQGLLWSLASDVLRDVESSDSSVDLVISLSSSHFQDPVVRVEA